MPGKTFPPRRGGRPRLDPNDPSVRLAADGIQRHQRRAIGAPATRYAPGDGSHPLSNKKHEEMAQLVAVQGFPEKKAYRAVYDPEGKRSSKHVANDIHRILRSTPSVIARVDYLTNWRIEERLKHVDFNAEYVIREMRKTYERAVRDQAYPAAVRALELLGYEFGMFVKKTQVEHMRRKPLDATGPQDLVEQFVALAREAFGPAVDPMALRALFETETGLTIDIEKVEDPREKGNGGAPPQIEAGS